MTLGPYSLDRVHQGYVPLALRALPSESVHCVITSPPYWGLRKYDCPDRIRKIQSQIKRMAQK